MPALNSIRAKVWMASATGLVVLLAAGRIWLIPEPFSLDPNEGWNAFQAAHAVGAGSPLYPPPDSLIGNNYPPVSFYLVGWAGLLFGNPIVSGRIIALISVLLVTACIFMAVRRFTGPDTPAPAIGAFLFLGFNVTLFRTYLCMDDPQWLAHALMSTGLLVLIPDRLGAPPAAKSVAAAALLMLLGGMVKHNLVAFPGAATLWLALHYRRMLVVWAVTAAAALLPAAMLCDWAYGADFFADLVAVDRHYSYVRMIVKSAPVIAATAPLLIVSASLARGRSSDRRIDLLLLAMAFSVPFDIFQRSGQGVDRNVHLEALIALCLAATVALDHRGSSPGKLLSSPRFHWLILPFLALVPIALYAEAKGFDSRARDETSWRQMENRIAATPGRVACENQALCYRAGKDFEIDFFLYGQRVAGRHDAAALQNAIDEHRFGAIELDAPIIRTGRLGEVDNPILAIIGRRYQAVFIDGNGRQLLEPLP